MRGWRNKFDKCASPQTLHPVVAPKWIALQCPRFLADLTTLAKGLVPNVKRDKNNRRVFDAHDIAWIKDLVCLKKCGMSIQEMKD